MTRRVSARPALITFIACLLIQAAWIIAMPPFRGIDEFDHAYRADSVAHGYWSASTKKPEDGTGALLPVRPKIVEAAEDVCSYYAYTGPDNCRAAAQLDNGLVLVGSGAASYNPVFYWVIGTPAQLADGSAALLLMRVISALLCSVFMAAAVYLLTLGFSTSWHRLALFVGLTPVLVYSTSIAAPNGLEMAVGAVVWSGLLALASDRLQVSEERVVLAWLTVASVVLVTLRQLGPLWFLMIVATCALLNGLSSYLGVAKRHPVQVTVSSVLIGAATVASAWWVLTAGSVPAASDLEGVNRLAVTLKHIPMWILQSIAAFPLRNEVAPTVVYVPYLLLGPVLAWLAWRYGSKRLRVTLVVFVLLSQIVPAAITYVTLDGTFPGWQGRYALPYTLGFLLLCTSAFEWISERRIAGPLAVAMWWSLTVAQATSVLSIFRSELDSELMMGVSLWPLLNWWFMPGLLVLASTGLFAYAASRSSEASVRPTGRRRAQESARPPQLVSGGDNENRQTTLQS